MLALLCALLLTAPASAEDLALDPSTGSLRAVFYKEGLLGALGHDHVVEARGFRGIVILQGSTASVSLDIPAAELEVDSAPARLAEGLKDLVAEGDRSKIAERMRGPKVLDVARYPKIAFSAQGIEPAPLDPGLWMVSGPFSLHGATATIDFPASLADRGDVVWVSGYARLRLSDYGIGPVSAAGGLVRVRDDFLVRFRLAARRRR